MPKRKKLTIYQYIIEKFIGNSKTIWSDREATKREIATAKKLLKAYPDKKNLRSFLSESSVSIG